MNSSHASHTSQNNGGGASDSFYSPSNGRFVSTPSNGSVNSHTAALSNNATSSVGSSGGIHRSGRIGNPASTNGNGSGNSTADVLVDSAKQKGIAKRKRKEFAKDARFVGVRRVVDGELYTYLAKCDCYAIVVLLVLAVLVGVAFYF